MSECDEVLEPIIVSIHDKGQQRGVSLYFGSHEIEDLERQGINLRDEKKLIAKPDNGHGRKGIKLLPLSLLEQDKREDFGTLFEITNRIGELCELKGDLKEDFVEELLSVLIGKQVETTPQERGAILHLIKGHHTVYTLQNTIKVCTRADVSTTDEITGRFVKKIEGGEINAF